jgi:hypothetical protein
MTTIDTTNATGLCFRGVLQHAEQNKNSDGKYLPFGRATFTTEKGEERINISEMLRHPMGDIPLSAFHTLINAAPGTSWELQVFAEATMYNGKAYVNLTATEAFPLD